MGRPLRHHPSEKRPFIVETTCRTIQGRYLLRPSEKVTAVILGIIGRALTLYGGINIIDFNILSNHYHFTLLAVDEQALAQFMGYINSLFARKIAAKFYNWNAKTWARRYRSISVIGEAAMIQSVRYIYSQGLHHNLVGRPELWPGACSVRARLFGEKLMGKWYDQTKMYQARRRGKEVNPEDYVTLYEIELAKLPCWSHLSDDEYRARMEAMVIELVLEADARWRDNTTRPLGARAVLEQKPWAWSQNMKVSDAPICRASTKGELINFLITMSNVEADYGDASERFRSGDFHVKFPNYTFPPFRPFERPGGIERKKGSEPPDL